MEQFFAQVGTFFTGIFGLAQGGFDGVNQILGLLIALIAAILMASWKRLWAMAVGATLIHLIIGVVRPALDGGEIRLPDVLTLPFWMTALALFLGYCVVIAIFFLIKSLFVKGGGKH